MGMVLGHLFMFLFPGILLLWHSIDLGAYRIILFRTIEVLKHLTLNLTIFTSALVSLRRPDSQHYAYNYGPSLRLWLWLCWLLQHDLVSKCLNWSGYVFNLLWIVQLKLCFVSDFLTISRHEWCITIAPICSRIRFKVFQCHMRSWAGQYLSLRSLPRTSLGRPWLPTFICMTEVICMHVGHSGYYTNGDHLTFAAVGHSLWSNLRPHIRA